MTIFAEATKKCPQNWTCKLTLGAAFKTAANWERVYDRHGALLTSNPNITTQQVKCGACGGEWIIKTNDAGIVGCEQTKQPASHVS